MHEVRADLDRWQHAGESIALATLVRVRRAAPRKPGARMLVTASGKIAGSVSGGCVESDVAAHAAEVLAAGSARMAHYGIADDVGLDVGLSCGGSIDVLIEPFETDTSWAALDEAVTSRTPAVLCIALAPRALLGRRMTVHADAAGATTAGAIHPALDDAIADTARTLLATGGTTEITLPHDGTEATIFFETFAPHAQLVIVGATEAGMHLARMATSLGFRVTVIDPRGVYATPERFPDAALIQAWPDEALRAFPLDPWSYVVTLTHDAKFDVPTLAHALRSPARYVGAMGSRRTHDGRKDALRAEGFTDTDLRRVHAPIGLAIGSRTPAEIALSILAEIVAVRSGKDMRPSEPVTTPAGVSAQPIATAKTTATTGTIA